MTEGTTQSSPSHIDGGWPPGAGSTPHPAGPHDRWVQDWRRSEVLDALRSLLDASNRVGPTVARRANLSHTELSMLEHVVKEPVGPTQLAHLLGVTSAAASGIVDRLAARGHVERRPHPTDGRRTAVVATPSGREEVLGHLMPMFVALAQIDAELTEDERQVVLRFLESADRAVRRLL